MSLELILFLCVVGLGVIVYIAKRVKGDFDDLYFQEVKMELEGEMINRSLNQHDINLSNYEIECLYQYIKTYGHSHNGVRVDNAPTPIKVGANIARMVNTRRVKPIGIQEAKCLRLYKDRSPFRKDAHSN